MEGVEKDYLNACIRGIIEAFVNIGQMRISEALAKVAYGKGDTLGPDATAELVLDKVLRAYDSRAIFLTEESQKKSLNWPKNQTPDVFISDPIDRTKYLIKFILKSLEIRLGQEINLGEKSGQMNLSQLMNLMADKGFDDSQVLELLNSPDAIHIWETQVDTPPVSVTAPTSSLTYLKRGKIIFSLLINYLTSDLIIASDMGIKSLKIGFDPSKNRDLDWQTFYLSGQEIIFPPWPADAHESDCLRIVTFLGKTGYKPNFDDSKILPGNQQKYIYHQEPGGPSRALYLSCLHVGYPEVGVIVINGEKLGEWIVLAAMVKFAKLFNSEPALWLFEVSHDVLRAKDGVLMSTPIDYSLFNCEDPNNCFLDIRRLQELQHPNHFRETLVVIPANNTRAFAILSMHNYRMVNACL